MTNNTTTASGSTANGCYLSEVYWTTAWRVQFACYHVVTHVYVIVCLPGYAFTWLVMRKQTGAEKAYIYQMFVTGSKTVEMITMALFAYAFNWGGVETVGLSWYKHSYALMWMTARTLALSEITMNISLCLALSMSIDRLFAIGRPVQYKQINRRRHQMVALFASIVIGAAPALYNVFLFNVVPNDSGGYDAKPDDQFTSGLVATVLIGLFNLIRTVGLLALIGCNAALISLYRRRSQQASKLTAIPSSSTKERLRKARERNLIQLTVCQSAFCVSTIGSEIIFYTAAYLMSFFYCYGKLLGPLQNMWLEISGLAEIIVPFLISKQLRETARTLFQGWAVESIS